MTDVPDPVALDACWDGLIRGNDACPGGVAPDDRRLLRDLNALVGPRPDPRFVSRLEVQLMDHAMDRVAAMPRPHHGLSGAPTDAGGRLLGPAQPSRWPWRPRRRALPLAEVSTAALVVVTLVVAYLVFGRPPGADQNRAVGPAAGTPSSAGVVEELLLAADLPALPGDPAEIELWRWTLAPDLVTTRPPGDFPGGVRVDYVLAGRYAARVDGPLLVARAAADGTAGAPEPIEPGTEVELGPGDAAIYPENERGQAWGNAGADPLVLLVAGVFDRTLPAPPAGLTVETLAFVAPHEVAGAFAVPEGPTRLTLRRLTLAPGAVQVEPPLAGPRFVHVEAGTLATTRQTTAQAAAGTPGAATTTWAGDTVRAASDTRATLRNAGAEPLVLLVLTIGPDG